MYQNTIVIGHLGDDPKMKYTQTGQAVTDFRIATTRKWKGQDGEMQEKTTWFRVSAWGKLAELCNQYLAKGRLVLVEGEIEASAFLDKTTNQPRASLELRARNVRFLGGRGEQGESAGSGERGAAAGGEEGDLPF
jgi:single-strand DNA-binding protein